MNKSTLFFGIDISKDYFDVYSKELVQKSYPNTKEGYKRFATTITDTSYCVMEATGCYHHKLCMFLHSSGISLSVLNPLIIKRFIQMKLRRIKTDKSEAYMIYTYASEQPLERWYPDAAYIVKSKELLSLIQAYSRPSTSLKNKRHALEERGERSGVVISSINRQLRQLKKEKTLLEEALEVLIKTHEPHLFSRLTSISGIGKKTTLLLMVSTSNFKTFSSYKQVSSYLGLAPNERSSGSSIRGQSRISKTGDGLLRNHLFMCSFTACIHNAQCKAIYDRIVAKGKSKKLALIAVCNKLLKQAFAIAKSGLPYDCNYATK